MNEPELASEIAAIHEKLDSAEEAVRADTEERRRENAKRDARILWSQRAIRVTIIVAVLAIVVAVGAIVFAKHQHDQDLSITRSRRAADCRSYTDVANAIKAGNVGAIQTLLDPEFQGPNVDPMVLQHFIEKFSANGVAGVDKAISEAKKNKGFSDDCTVIGNPPNSGG